MMKKSINLVAFMLLAVMGFSAYGQSVDTVAHGKDYGKGVTLHLKNHSKVMGTVVYNAPGDSIVIKNLKGDIVTYQCSEISQIKRRHVIVSSFGKGFNGEGPQKGYHGNVLAQSIFKSDIAVSTTHGYQFSPTWFAGVGYQFYHESGVGKKLNHLSTIYAEGRCCLTQNKLTPYVGIRFGKPFDDRLNYYLSPALGLRLGLGHSRIAAVLEISYDKYDEKSNAFICDESMHLRLGFEF